MKLLPSPNCIHLAQRVAPRTARPLGLASACAECVVFLIDADARGTAATERERRGGAPDGRAHPARDLVTLHLGERIANAISRVQALAAVVVRLAAAWLGRGTRRGRP